MALRFPCFAETRKTRHFLETASLSPPPAALRRFPLRQQSEMEEVHL